MSCKWCKGITYWDHDTEEVHIHVHVKTKEIWVYSPPQCSDIDVSMPIKYCPMCGENLEVNSNGDNG